MLNEEGAKLLKKVIIKKYGKVELEKIVADENEFNFDFKINENIGENDLADLEKEMFLGTLSKNIILNIFVSRKESGFYGYSTIW